MVDYVKFQLIMQLCMHGAILIHWVILKLGLL
jgi:hypothetical protein